MSENTITPEDIKAKLTEIGREVKDYAEKAKVDHGKLSEDVKESIDKVLVKQGELQAELLDLQQKSARRGAEVSAGEKSAGQMMTESEAFKSYVAAGDYRKGFNMPLKAITNITSATSGTGGAGSAIAPDRLNMLIAAPNRRMTVRDLLTPGTTSSNLIQYVRETGFQNSAATVAETTAKPKSDIAFDLVATPVVKIATYVKASTEILQDAAMMQSYIDGRLRYMLMYVEEAQLLNGSGTGNNLNGINTQATAYAAPIVITSPTRIDILRLALLQAELALYPSTGIVINPADWAAIELQKDTTGEYIFANPQGIAQPSMWGRPVVSTQAMAVDNFLAGAFQLGAQIFDRMQAAVMVSTENEDDFIKNMVTILAEERLGLAVYRPQCFVKGKITPV